MKTLRKRLMALLLIAAILVVGLPSFPAKATTASGEFMVAPPSGANISSRFVSVGSSYIDSSLPQVVVITDNLADRTGGLWTTGRLDLRFSFSVNLFVYWGRSQSQPMGSFAGQTGGDGMSISLHNDPRGTSALGGRGGAVGSYLRPGEPAVVPLRNAISFELDPFVNNSAGDFDEGMSVNTTTPNLSRHMAFVVPNNPVGSANHNSLSSFQAMGFSDSVWVPVTVSWTPSGAAGTLSVNVNGNTRNYPIANYSTFFGGNLAFFGFTGATGGVTALQAIAMQNLPLFTYNMSFNLNGGSGTTPATQTVQENSLATAPTTTPTRTGFTFSGWNTAANGSGTTWNFATTRMPQNDVTLFAQWTRNNYNLAFSVNGGNSATPTTQLVPFDNLAINPGNPTRVGYNFTGWNTNSVGGGTTWNFATTRMPASNTTLFAQWSIASFLLSFNLNGGDGSAPPAQSVRYGSLATEPSPPVRLGHSFTGWNTLAAGNGTTWNFNVNTMPGNAQTLFAQWSVNNYDLSFNVNGGDSAAPTSQSIPFGTLASAPATPTRVGHTFTGWNTAADGSGTAWNFNTTTMPAVNTTLFAQWDINTYDLSFNVNGGDSGSTPATQPLTFGSLGVEPAIPTRVGHTFQGWNTLPNGTGTTWNFSTSTMPANNLTLFAQWSANHYDLSFNVNGGDSIPPTTQSVVFDTLATAPSAPTRLGYTFTGWNTAANGSGTAWNFATTRMPAAHTELFAQWSINSYNLSFNVNGGDSAPPATQSVAFDTLATAPAIPTRVGHSFSSWNTAANGSGMTWDFTTTRMPAAHTELFAQWTINSYDLSFNVNGGDSGTTPTTQTLVFGTLGVEPTAPTKLGHTFHSWNTLPNGTGVTWNFNTSTMPGYHVTLYAQWSTNSYNLSFNVNGGNSVPPTTQSVVFDTLATAPSVPTRLGYSFTGWNTAANGSGTMWNFTTTRMPAAHTELFAQWSINSYNLSFNVNGGNSVPPTTQSVVFNTLATEPLIPTRVGYTFVGWNTAANGSGASWDFNTTLMPAAHTELFAQWSINSYNLSFNVNGGNSATPTTQSVVFNTLATAPANPTKVGYSFSGWNTAANGSGTTWNFTTTRMPAAHTELFAQWSINSYDLSFNVNGGNIGTAPPTQSLVFGTLGTEPTAPTKLGHTFHSWNTLPNGTGSTWNFSTSTMPGYHLTLYAQWSTNSYDLSFNVNGGDSVPPTTQSVVFDTLAIAPSVPTRLGYTFTGWNTAANGSGTVWNFTTTRMPAAHTELFAQWTINSYNLSFNVNGGNSVPPTTQSVVFNTLATAPAIPTRVGYSFSSWNTAANGSGTTWNFATTRMPAAHTELFAQWTINSYDLSFNVNGGDSGTTPTTQNLVFGTLGIEPTAPTKLGHTFQSWNTLPNGTGTTWNFSTSTMPGYHMTLYAQWSINSYDLSFNVNGGDSVPPTTQSVVFNALATAPSIPPTRVGYSFSGWNTAADGSGVAWNFTTTRMPAAHTELFAQWSINSYDLSFNVNGGNTGTTPSTQSLVFGTLGTEPTAPTKLGHTFHSWNTLPNGTGITWNFSTTTMPGYHVTLYAQWSINSYDLSFNVNGGDSVPPITQSVVFNTFATAPAIPTRLGHTFVNWNTMANGSGMTWYFATTPMPAAHTELFAQWSINSYTLSFDVNEGETDAPDNQLVVFDTLATEPAPPEREGYTFTGWNTAANGSGTVWNFATTRMPAVNTKLFAQWSINIYTVAFNVNDGDSPTPGNQLVPFRALATDPGDPTRLGHTFIGWNTLQNGSGQSWNFDLDRMPSRNITLFAQWSVNSYPLHFQLNGGSGSAPTSQSVVFDTTAMPVTDPVRSGFVFAGWNTLADGTGTTWDFSSTRMPAQEVTLFAQWTRDSFSVTFDLNQGDGTAPVGQNVLYQDFVASVPDPSRIGHVFVGWNTAIDGSGVTWDFATNRMPANPITLHAQWVLDIFNLHFNINGGAGMAPVSQEVLFGMLATPVADPSREGHTFYHWNQLQNGSGAVWDFLTTTMPAENTVLYAQWQINSYRLSFDLQGGEGSPPASQDVIFEDFATAVTDPSREGHTFLGWNTVSDGSGITWDFATTRMPAQPVTLYARWEINQYNLHFNTNGGQSVPPSPQRITFGELSNAVSEPTRIGYTFRSWNTAANGSGTTWNFATTTMPAEDVTLYAQWTINSYDLSFDVNGGDSVNPPSQSVIFDELAVKPDEPTRLGHTFSSWNTKADGSGITWKFSKTRMPAADTTLYAQWNVNEYKLSFDINGGDEGVPPSQRIDFGDIADQPPVPRFAGHTFLGWNREADGSGDFWDFSSTTMPAYDVLLYAIWQRNLYRVTFDSQGGSDVVSQNILFRSLLREPLAPVKPGHIFLGWYKDSSLTEAWDFNRDKVENSMTLYAGWIKNQEPPRILAPVFTEIKVNSFFDPIEGVKAFDWFDDNITELVAVKGEVDTSTPGIYQVFYIVEDVVGNQATATQIVLVNDGSFVQNDGYIINASDFKLGLSEYKISDQEMAARAKVTVYSIFKRQFLALTDLQVDRSQLRRAVGVYPITFTFNPTITVRVTIINDIPVVKTGETASKHLASALALSLLAGALLIVRKRKFREDAKEKTAL